MVGAGFWLARSGQTTSFMYSGVALVIAGGWSLFLTVAYFVWVDLFSN